MLMEMFNQSTTMSMETSYAMSPPNYINGNRMSMPNFKQQGNSLEVMLELEVVSARRELVWVLLLLLG